MSADEKILPRPDILNELEYGKFVLANLAAKRAKQIKDGAPPLVRIDSNHPLSIALAEISAGKIKPIMGGDAAAVDLDEDFSILDNMEISEVGLLLPAIDDEEIAVVIAFGGALGDDDESDEDVDDAITAMSLSDVLDDGVDEEEEEVAVAETDDAEMSLDDLAQQEESEDGDAPEEV